MTPAQLYASPFHHLGLLLGGAIVSSLALAPYTLGTLRFRRAPAPAPTSALPSLSPRSDFLLAWSRIFSLTIVFDAALTSDFSPLHPWPLAARIASIFFVFAGDFRAFVLIDRFASPERTRPRTLATATAWSLIAPLSTAIATRLTPAHFSTLRNTFLFYEIVSLSLFFIRALTLRRASIAPEVRAWLMAVCVFFIIVYFSWALCDVLILCDVTAAYIARIAPNVLYYVLFVPFAALGAPRRLRP